MVSGKEDPDVQLERFSQVLNGFNCILNDDMTEARTIFAKDNGSFHLCGRAVIVFIEAVLTFEPSKFTASLDAITAANKSLEKDRAHAVKHSITLSTFDPGVEYQVANGLLLILSALIGFCSESIVTSVKAVYKLRKAHIIFDKITKKRYETFVKGAPPTGDPRRDGINEFVQSATLLCSGLFTLLISLLPPKMIRILNILGYNSDRDWAIKTMWTVNHTYPTSFFAAVSFAALIQFYSGAVQLCDIYKTTPEQPDGWPAGDCFKSLQVIQKTFPSGPMWPLHRAKLLSMIKQSEEALEVLDEMLTRPAPQLKQLQVLIVFEHALDSAFCHKYVESARSFLQLSKLNDSSTALYSYFAAACFLQDVRVNGNPQSLSFASSLLEPLYDLVAKTTAPLDIHIRRKLLKLINRRKTAGGHGGLAEYVGFSPLYELTYVWNGFRRMNQHELVMFDLERVEPWQDEDDMACQLLIKVAVLRNLGRVNECFPLLEELRGMDKKTSERWAVGFGLYEMAVALYETGSTDQTQLKECDRFLKAARDFGSNNEFESRLTIRVQMARSVVKDALREKHNTRL
ncbi:eukaryotic protein [Schizosaccharomyces japonicus yFS275]|uniref:Eukaryotic protein n=1 Tax=Schizosaccharomyces japonicus (strain yFS275 / FY16936) TaxID=402676 RepID=B6JV66_SCHJY|nr:eukaryotic protein [Schizosaccharomyces japonicus yFS275]EEB05267.1 eukaryotic protein [Schizosaccharomyces japonicus yFS275]